MKPISIYTSAAQASLAEGDILLEKMLAGYIIQFVLTENSLWLKAGWQGGGQMLFRAVYSVDNSLTVGNMKELDNSTTLDFTAAAGKYSVTVEFPDLENPLFRYTTKFIPAADFYLPNWPRDIMPMFRDGKTENTNGTIHATQVGTRSGNLFFSMTNPKSGSVFYFQDLTSLNDFCEATETSAGELVGGEWPEIGFRLPEVTQKPLPAKKQYTISDAYVRLSDEIPANNYEMSKQYINYLAEVYMLIQKPRTVYRDWPTILEKGLEGLTSHKGCWQFADGRSYLNAYVSDYATPPESMVQLAVLLPLADYDKWSGQNHPIIEELKNGLPNFYDEEIGSLVRWLPAYEDKLDESEEQKQPRVMDSWYLHHPLMNLSRLALEGDEAAKELLLKSIDYVIKVARHFDYEWPVFYKMDTLEIIKAETAPGQGGEKDVPGAYAHLMIQMWQLTGEKRYLLEAKKAAKKLDGLGFDLFYQANNTSFTAGALLRLYKETKDKLYLNLSYVCIAAILKNVQLWECNYGYGKYLNSFFAIFPLKDAPYTAAYEEQEVYAGVLNYLYEARNLDILPSVRMLLAELVKYVIHRVVHYYPTLLPREMISDEVKTGEIDSGLWVALEDICDGWEKSGKVGQEVYGAGIAFGIVPRQYLRIDEIGIMIFSEYPALNITRGKNRLSFYAEGSPELSFRLAVLLKDESKQPKYQVKIKRGSKTITAEPVSTNSASFIEYIMQGGANIVVTW